MIKFLTWLRVVFGRARQAGIDPYGNVYYRQRLRSGKERRWVVYKGLHEASKVPPLWHAWLHSIDEDTPGEHDSYPWQKTHQPNLTGTDYAYSFHEERRYGLDGVLIHGNGSLKGPKMGYKAWRP